MCADTRERYLLTPPVSPKPRINGAKAFGLRPGSPSVFTVAASGRQPLHYSATGLPEGLRLDETTGRIIGTVDEPGAYKVNLTVRNDVGKAHRALRIVVGEAICLTPPMGWNSWYCFSEAVNQEKIIAMANAMVSSGLAAHGWSYVNIDDCWQGERGGPHMALQGNERFPDMKAMSDAVHDLGLRVGIYSTPWMGSYAGFPGGSCDNAAGDYSAHALPLEQRLQPAQLFGRCPGTLDLGLDTVGPYWFCDADAKQWAEWGIDYVKYDWYPNDVPTTRRLAEGLRHCGRDIVLSLSNDAPFENVGELALYANLWRTTGDIQDSWESICRIGFSQEYWQPYSGPGHWNDPDMLQVGNIGVPNQVNETTHPSGLTPDEQYTQMSLWVLLSAPLLLSCDLHGLDAFTLNLLTNDEVIEVNQDPSGESARQIAVDDDARVWAKLLEDGSLAVGLFNLAENDQPVTVTWSDLGINGSHRVRDLWRQRDLAVADHEFFTTVRPHGVTLVRMIPVDIS